MYFVVLACERMPATYGNSSESYKSVNMASFQRSLRVVAITA